MHPATTDTQIDALHQVPLPEIEAFLDLFAKISRRQRAVVLGLIVRHSSWEAWATAKDYVAALLEEVCARDEGSRRASASALEADGEPESRSAQRPTVSQAAGGRTVAP